MNATEVGGRLAAFLGAPLGQCVVTPRVNTAATRPELAYGLLGALNANRLAVYAESAEAEANAARRELLKQAQAAVCALRANQPMLFNVPESQGHDDHLSMLALVTQTVEVRAARSAVGRAGRQDRHGAFGDDHPSRR